MNLGNAVRAVSVGAST